MRAQWLELPDDPEARRILAEPDCMTNPILSWICAGGSPPSSGRPVLASIIPG